MNFRLANLFGSSATAGEAAETKPRTSTVPIGPPPPRPAPEISRSPKSAEEAKTLTARRKRAGAESFRAKKIIEELDQVKTVALPSPAQVLAGKPSSFVGMV